MARKVYEPEGTLWLHDLPDNSQEPEGSIWLCEHCDGYFRVVVADGGGRYWVQIGWLNFVWRYRIRKGLQQMKCGHDE